MGTRIEEKASRFRKEASRASYEREPRETGPSMFDGGPMLKNLIVLYLLVRFAVYLMRVLRQLRPVRRQGDFLPACG